LSPPTTIGVQTACHGDAGSYHRGQEFWASWPPVLVRQTSPVGVQVHHEAPVTWPQLR